MPSYLDLGLLLIVAVSALLSMVRGFTREILAIASWGAAAVAGYYLYPYVLPYVTPYIAKETIAKVVSIAAVFFATLIIVSIVTVKLSEAILDSKVGALDRTLGFLFGAARGFLLGVVAFLFFTWLVQPSKQPDWVTTAKSKPLLEATGNEIKALLPVNPENTFLKHLGKDKTEPSEDVPADSESPPASPDPTMPQQKTEAVPHGANPPAASPTTTDRQKLDNLLGKGGAQPGKKP